jgi:hypothetical protein
MEISMRLLIATVLMLFCTHANLVFAEMYAVEAVGEYVMGDSDTKLEARRIALEQAKRSAVEQIGTYLESETIVVNNALTKDEIRTYTAAVLKTIIISEALALLEDKSTVFRVKIKANVDAGVLDKKILEIKEDSQRKTQLAMLQVENTKLLKELENLSSQLKAGNGEGSRRLRGERESLFAKLDKNENAIQFAFEKGALLNLALENQDTLAQELKDVDVFFQMVADNVKFKLGEPKIRLVGDTAELVVDVSYHTENIAAIRDIFYRKFSVDRTNCHGWGNEKGDENFCIFRGSYKGFGFTGINGEAVFSYFTHKNIDLVLQLGTMKDVLNIANRSKRDLGSWMDSPGGYYIKTVNRGYDNKVYFKISNIPKDELKNINSINAKIVISNQ